MPMLKRKDRTMAKKTKVGYHKEWDPWNGEWVEVADEPSADEPTEEAEAETKGELPAFQPADDDVKSD